MGISSGLGSSALLPAGLGFRNKIINGGFDIWQRGTSFTTNGAYTADRWQMSFTGTGTAQTVSQVGFTAGNQISNQEPVTHIRSAVTGGSGNSSLVALTQKIEDVRSCAGQQVAVSFWAKVTSGTASLGLDLYQDFGSGGSTTVGGIGAQKFSLTTSWQRFTAIINVSSISGKTLGANSFLALRFWFSSGSDYNSLNGTLGIQSATFDIWGVQLEQNYQPTPFEQRPIGVELLLCQRYYQTVSSSDLSFIAQTSTRGWMFTSFPVPLRVAVAATLPATPMVNALNDPYVSLRTITSIGTSSSTTRSAVFEVGVSAGGMTLGSYILYIGPTIAFNAEFM